MSLVTEPEPETRPGATGEEAALRDLTAEVRKQGRSIKATQHAFIAVAALALIIAMFNLIAVAAKLDKKTTTTKAAAPAAAAAPATTAAALPSRVTVGLKEFSVNPSSSAAKAGKVTFAVRNTGKVTHEMVVLATNKPAADLLKGSRADETGNVGETGDLKPGASKTFAITLKPGHYALICNLPGHYAAGQHTDFTVKG
ncbi:MAG: cupredoxin domain-containing protein [Solirubrobacteraceae bacterium]